VKARIEDRLFAGSRDNLSIKDYFHYFFSALSLFIITATEAFLPVKITKIQSTNKSKTFQNRFEDEETKASRAQEPIRAM
jgi:hypothetical protein